MCVRARGHIVCRGEPQPQSQRRTRRNSEISARGSNVRTRLTSGSFSPQRAKVARPDYRPIPESADSGLRTAVGVIRAACSADRRAPMRTGIIRAPATPVVAAEARPFVMELSTSIFTHPSIVPMCVSLSVVCCLILWCMRCDWFKSRRKAESKPLLSCGDGSDPWEAEDLIVQIGVPAREFVRISTIPPCSGVWKGSIELRACSQSPGGVGSGGHAAVSSLARFGCLIPLRHPPRSQAPYASLPRSKYTPPPLPPSAITQRELQAVPAAMHVVRRPGNVRPAQTRAPLGLPEQCGRLSPGWMAPRPGLAQNLRLTTIWSLMTGCGQGRGEVRVVVRLRFGAHPTAPTVTYHPRRCVALRPCGHEVLCRNCADFVYTCPHCRQYISAVGHDGIA